MEGNLIYEFRVPNKLHMECGGSYIPAFFNCLPDLEISSYYYPIIKDLPSILK